MSERQIWWCERRGRDRALLRATASDESGAENHPATTLGIIYETKSAIEYVAIIRRHMTAFLSDRINPRLRRHLPARKQQWPYVLFLPQHVGDNPDTLAVQ